MIAQKQDNKYATKAGFKLVIFLNGCYAAKKLTGKTINLK